MAANNNKDRIILGAAAAGLAAGLYFFGTDQGKKQAKKMRGWMVKMKGEVLEKLEEAEEVTEPVYREIVDTVANAQMIAEKIPRSEILQLATDLKRQWNRIRKMSSAAPAARRHSPRKKTASKRSSKKAARKK